GTLVFNSTADSLELMVSPAYATIRMLVDGQRLAYVAYADKVQQSEIVDFYNSAFPPADGEEPAVGNTDNGGFIRMDINALKSQKMPNENLINKLPAMQHQAIDAKSSDLFNKIVSSFATVQGGNDKTPVIDVYMFREKGAHNILHEIGWQVNDMVYSLKNVQPNIIVRFSVLDSDFAAKPLETAESVCNRFVQWFNKTTYKDMEGIFCLCRWGNWDNGKLSFNGIYDVNHNNNRVFGITSTSALKYYTFAHVVGFNFGAELVETSMMNIDLMSNQVNLWDWKHNNKANRHALKVRLTYKN
ncbi:MAG: hypothetical protein RR706_09560, partial [Muribaculaceae bacterium]